MLLQGHVIAMLMVMPVMAVMQWTYALMDNDITCNLE